MPSTISRNRRSIGSPRTPSQNFDGTSTAQLPAMLTSNSQANCSAWARGGIGAVGLDQQHHHAHRRGHQRAASSEPINSVSRCAAA